MLKIGNKSQKSPSWRPRLWAHAIRALLIFAGTVAIAHGQASIEPILRTWTHPPAERQLPVISSSASTVVDAPSGNYASAKAHDGNRATKWVAANKPGEAAPQWLEIALAGEQAISSVAVFGEAVGNDGIVDAEIQVAPRAPANFRTVAVIADATAGAWRAAFPTITASRLRLVVTRSSGPSAHTDVYEVEVYGPRLDGAKLVQRARLRLAEAEKAVASPTDPGALQALELPPGTWLGSFRRAEAGLKGQLRCAAEDLKASSGLVSGELEKLGNRIDLLAEQARQFAEQRARTRELLEPRARWVKASQLMLDPARDEASAREDDMKIRLFNHRVLLECDKKNGSWSGFWNGQAAAGIRHAGFSLQCEGKTLNPDNAKVQVTSFQDRLGRGKQISQSWGDHLRVERFLRVYDGSAAITLSARMKNLTTHDLALGTLRAVEFPPGASGWWQLGDPGNVPGSVFVAGISELQCDPGRKAQFGSDDQQDYHSSGTLALADPEARTGLVVGFLTALEANPEVGASFRSGAGGTALTAQERFLGRRLGPGESLESDPVYICANDNAYAALEDYADAAGAFAQVPVRHGATALWCSWYAHRMAMTEDLVLANAAVAAKHFKPLGFEIVQLDHGWQRGDITGDWVAKEQFPHGLKWLSEQLQNRYGFRLGVWIAPTDAAEPSETFQRHADWMLKDEQGNPRVNWRWYWAPNPNCYEIDASNPAAGEWIQDVFARLTALGVSYYKIDFIASAGGEQFMQHDPKVTRGWSVLRAAMEAVRRGAGTNAWIRYCQTPPLLSAGLADSAYGGSDTLDAGLNGNIGVLSSNARSLAAGYWIQDRLYHREVCDLSVRMQADVEETRLRLAMMTLAGCSISFSDELQYLPPSRIRMMQSALPPGNPAMKPLDLFERAIPSTWLVHCATAAEQWDTVGLFNFGDSAETRLLDFRQLPLPADAEVAVFEFWEQKFLGLHRTNLSLTLPPQSSRILSLRRAQAHPQVIGTDMHLLQGYHELKAARWDQLAGTLSGQCQRMAGVEGRLLIHVPPGYSPHFEFPLNAKSARLTHVEGRVWACELKFETARVDWSIPFDRAN